MSNPDDGITCCTSKGIKRANSFDPDDPSRDDTGLRRATESAAEVAAMAALDVDGASASEVLARQVVEARATEAEARAATAEEQLRQLRYENDAATQQDVALRRARAEQEAATRAAAARMEQERNSTLAAARATEADAAAIREKRRQDDAKTAAARKRADEAEVRRPPLLQAFPFFFWFSREDLDGGDTPSLPIRDES